MLQNFLLVAQQIVVLLLLVLAGFFCGKYKLITDSGVKTCTNVVLYLSTPAIIINSYIREFDVNLLADLGISLGLSLLFHVVGIIIARIIYPAKKKDDSSAICHYATIFSNAGYMALPLQAAILGDVGVFFGSSYVVMFNLLSWTYGIWYVGRDNSGFSLKKLINPGVIAVVIGIILFVFSIPVNSMIRSSINHIGSLNTPLPMIIIGYYISKSNLLKSLKNNHIYIVSAMRLVIIPLIAIALMYLMKIPGAMLTSMTIAVASPVAVKTAMLAVMFDRNEELGVNLVSFSTLATLLTMPIIIAFAQSL